MHEKVNPKEGPEAPGSTRRRIVAPVIMKNGHRLCEEKDVTILARL